MSIVNAPDPEVRAARRQAGPRQRPAPDRAAQARWRRSRSSSPARRARRSSTPTAPNISTRWPGCGASTSATAAPSSPRSPPSRCEQIAYYPAHRDERAGRGARREDQRADGRRLSHLLRQLGLRGQRGRLQDRPAIREARVSRASSASRPSAATTPITARRWRRSPPAAWATARRSSSRSAGEFVHVAAAVLLSLPVRPELPELRPRLRQEHRDRDPRRRAGHASPR